MSSPTRSEDGNHFIGVDVGGTKIVAAVVNESGTVVLREKIPTPRGCSTEETLQAIEGAITTVLDESASLIKGEIHAIGVAIPGVVNPERGFIVVTPNMNLSGVDLRKRLKKRFDLPIALGNDCNLGALGEKWLGSGRGASSLVAILVGTGVGAGIVLGKKLWRGANESAAEIGHTVMQIGGPKCGCGNLGCLEALCSRSAIERDIRAAVEQGKKSIVSDLLDGDLSVIRSGVLSQALELKDRVVEEVLEHASVVLGHLCLTVRHLLDPEVIVLGGGVMEACSDYMLPTIRSIVADDQLMKEQDSDVILLCALGDDAVLLGAVALARSEIGDDPFKTSDKKRPTGPKISIDQPGTITVGRRRRARNTLVRVEGSSKKWKNPLDSQPDAPADQVGRFEVARACRGGPEILFIGTRPKETLSLTREAEDFLKLRRIDFEIAPLAEAVKAFNKSDQRKAGMFLVEENDD